MSLSHPKPMGRHHAFRSVLDNRPSLAPADGSVSAYVRWLQQHRMHGEWLQCDLYGDYETICALAGYEPSPLRTFKASLLEAGCECWQGDSEKDGRRYRPEMVYVPRHQEMAGNQ